MHEENYAATHVMLAEDDDDDYYMFSMAVNDISFKVLLTRAENGEILMKLLEEKTPDILFLDIHMPCRDGQECLAEIRANRKYDNLPVIIYSSLDHLQHIEQCFRGGANLFAVKPSTYSDLKTVLERILTVDWKKVLYYPTLDNFVMRAS